MIHISTTYKEKVSLLISWGHWFSLFNILFTMFLGTSYIVLSNVDLTLLSILYALLSWSGHFAMLIFIGYLVLVFPLTFIVFSQRALRFITVLLATATTLVLLLDIYSFSIVHMHLNNGVIELLTQIEHQDGANRWRYIFLALPIVFIIQLWASEWIWRKQHRLAKKKIGLPIAFAFVVALASSHIIYALSDAYLYQPIIDQQSNLPLSYPMTARRFLERHGFLDKQEYVRNRQLMDQTQRQRIFHYPAQPITLSPISNHYNVLIVMINGLRADTPSSTIMPYLNNFAQQNNSFSEAFSGGSYRETSLFSLLYGLPNNYQNYVQQQNTPSVLLSSLKSQKYQLASFTKQPLIHFIAQQFHSNNRTLETSDNTPPTFKEDSSDLVLINQWQKWTQMQKNKPWFSYLELSSVEQYQQNKYAQQPFQPAFNSALAQSDPLAPLILENSYYNASYFADHLIQIIINNLEQTSQLDNTVVIITSPYGLDFKQYQQTPYFSIPYRREKLHIPLIIRWPQRQISAMDKIKLASQLDIVPTLMNHLLGSKTPIKAYSTGEDLLTSEETNVARHWVLSSDTQSFAIIEPDQTSIVNNTGENYVFDLYNQQQDKEPKLSILVTTGNELQRFLTRVK